MNLQTLYSNNHADRGNTSSTQLVLSQYFRELLARKRAAMKRALERNTSLSALAPIFFDSARGSKHRYNQINGLFLLIVLLGGISQALATRHIYVANYGSNDVSAYAINTSTGTLTPIAGSPFVTGLSPTAISLGNLSASPFYAYVANTNANTISAYSIDANFTGALTPVPGSPFATGLGPTAIASTGTSSGNFVYVANGSSNTVSAYAINSTGGLIPVAGSPFVAGSGPIAIHIISPTAGVFFAYVVNSNSNDVSAYAINTSTGALTSVAGSPFAAGSSPTAINIFGNNNPGVKTYAYVANAISNTLSAYVINTTTGAMTQLLGSPFAAGSSPSAIAIAGTSNTSFAYVSNATSNDVSAYAINAATGTLTPVSGSPFAAGSAPSSVTADSNFVYVANRDSNNISAYTISATGTLTPVAGSPFAAGTKPASIISAGSNSTIYTSSTSTGVGSTNATYYWVKTSVGDGVTATAVGDFGSCTLPPGPYLNCTLVAGSGSIVDPYLYQCTTPLALSNCTLPGTSIILDGGQIDIDIRQHTQTVSVAPILAAPTSIPTLNEWGMLLLSGLLGLFGFIKIHREFK